MIDLTVNREVWKRNVKIARENGVVIPTFAQLKDPSGVPSSVLENSATPGSGT